MEFLELSLEAVNPAWFVDVYNFVAPGYAYAPNEFKFMDTAIVVMYEQIPSVEGGPDLVFGPTRFRDLDLETRYVLSHMPRSDQWTRGNVWISTTTLARHTLIRLSDVIGISIVVSNDFKVPVMRFIWATDDEPKVRFGYVVLESLMDKALGDFKFYDDDLELDIDATGIDPLLANDIVLLTERPTRLNVNDAYNAISSELRKAQQRSSFKDTEEKDTALGAFPQVWDIDAKNLTYVMTQNLRFSFEFTADVMMALRTALVNLTTSIGAAFGQTFQAYTDYTPGSNASFRNEPGITGLREPVFDTIVIEQRRGSERQYQLLDTGSVETPYRFLYPLLDKKRTEMCIVVPVSQHAYAKVIVNVRTGDYAIDVYGKDKHDTDPTVIDGLENVIQSKEKMRRIATAANEYASVIQTRFDFFLSDAWLHPVIEKAPHNTTARGPNDPGS